MQNQEDQSREPLSGESEASGQTLDLGRRIYARYAGSPGVISMGLGPGLARQVYQFSDRLPLLHTLHRRWNMDGVPFSSAPSPLWLRALASPKSAEHSTALAPRMAGAGSFSTSPKLEGNSGRAMPPGPEAQILQPTQSAARKVARVRQATGDSGGTSLTENRHGAAVRSGNSVPNVHAQRRAGAEYGKETKAAGATAGASHVIPQQPPAPATSDGKSLPTVAEGGGLKPPAPGPAQMGPPIFWRQMRGPLAQANRQNGVPPERKQGYDSSVNSVPAKGASGRQRVEGEMVAGGPLPANPVHVTRSKAAAEVARAVTPNPQKVPLANGPQDLTVGTARYLGAEASVLPPAAKTSENSASRRSLTPAHGPDQTDRVRPVVAAEHSIAGPGGGSAAAPLVQRKAIALPALGSQSSSAEGVLEGAAPRMDPPADQVVVSSSRPEGTPLSITPSGAPNADAVWNLPGGASVVHRMDSTVDEASVSSSKAEKIPLSVSPSMAPHANAVGSQLSVTGSPVSGSHGSSGHGSGGRVSTELGSTDIGATDIGSSLAQRHPDGLIEHPAKPTAPPLVQRKATALPSPRSKSSNVESLVEGAAERMDMPADEAVVSSSKLESVPLSVTPSAAPNADAVWNQRGGADLIHRMDPPADEASVSSSKAERIPLSVAPFAANADAVGSQPSVAGSPVSGDPVSRDHGSRGPVSTDLGSADLGSSLAQRHPDGLIAYPAKPSAPPLVQRRAMPLSSPRSKSSNAGSLAEGVAHRMDPPVDQGAASSAKPESTLLTVVPSTAPSADAVWNQPGLTGSPFSGGLRSRDLGSSLAQRHRDDRIAYPAIPIPSVNETGETPVNAVLASNMPTVVSREPIIDQTIARVPDATAANLAQSQLHERLEFPNTAGAVPVLRRATRLPGSTATMGHPAFPATHALGLAGKSEVTHRVWRRADAGLTQPEPGRGATHSRTDFAVVQRSPANSAGATGVQTPPAPPSLPDQSNPMSQTLPGGDINQLTNRVYELLVRRLAGEKQQRGL